jgi:hypothetical protein
LVQKSQRALIPSISPLQIIELEEEIEDPISVEFPSAVEEMIKGRKKIRNNIDDTESE